MFALTLVPVSIGVGAAIDYSRGNQVRTSLQQAVDTAVLAAAIDSTSNWQTVAQNAFSGNLRSKNSAVGAPSFTLDNAIYSGTVNASAQTAFLGVIGIQSISVTARSAATTSKVPLCVLALNSLE